MKHPKLAAFCKRAWPVLLVIALLCGLGTVLFQMFGLSPAPDSFSFAAGSGSAQGVAIGFFSLEGILWDGMILCAVLAGAAFLVCHRRR